MKAPVTNRVPKPVVSFDFYKVATGLVGIAFLLALSTWLANLVLPALGNLINDTSFAQKNFVLKSFLLVFTLLAMWGLHRKMDISFGFTRGVNLAYGRFTKHAVLLGFAGLLALIIINVLGFVITRKTPAGFPEEQLLHRILFIWIWSSLVEEVLFRGLFQSWIGHMRKTVFRFRKANISQAVLLSGLAFATLHLTLLFQGMSAFFVAGIFINTLLLGLLAGYLREKTGSLYPAIYVHILFNIVGSLPLLLQTLITR